MPLSYSGPGWTVERVESLKRLWADGLSASQIAAELGFVTRGGVIGKVHRIGLSGRAKSPSSTSPRPRKARASGLTVRMGGGRASFNPAHGAATPEPAPDRTMLAAHEAAIPFAQRKTLVQLADTSCRWPVGDPQAPDFFFCGGDSEVDHQYCAFHCRIAYQPARDRRRDRTAPRGFNGGAAA